MAVEKKELDVLAAIPHATGIPELVKIDGSSFPTWGYAMDVNDQLSWRWKATNYLSGNVTVYLDWYSRSGAVSNSVTWGGALSVLTPGDNVNMETDGLATENTQATNVNTGANTKAPTRTTLTISNLDSLAADDTVEMRIRCTAKTMSGDAILVGIEVEYAATDGVGAGNVSNAGAGTDNAVARFDTTGEVLQNSGVIIDDSNNVTGVAALTASGTVTANAFVGIGIASVVTLGSDQTGIGAGPSTITGLNFSIPAAGTYQFDYDVGCVDSNTTSSSHNMAVAFSGSTTSLINGVDIQNIQSGSPTYSRGVVSGSGTAFTGASATTATAQRAQKCGGTLVCSSSGTLSVQIGRSSGTVTAKAGSTARIKRLA